MDHFKMFLTLPPHLPTANLPVPRSCRHLLLAAEIEPLNLDLCSEVTSTPAALGPDQLGPGQGAAWTNTSLMLCPRGHEMAGCALHQLAPGCPRDLHGLTHPDKPLGFYFPIRVIPNHNLPRRRRVSSEKRKWDFSGGPAAEFAEPVKKMKPWDP